MATLPMGELIYHRGSRARQRKCGNLESALWFVPTTKVVADLSFTKKLSFNQQEQPQDRPTFLFINPDGINK